MRVPEYTLLHPPEYRELSLETRGVKAAENA
jgi:hypothetical protein